MQRALALALPLTLASYAAASVAGPVINSDFPDPSILKTSGGTYAYATNGAGYNIQVATSPDGGNTWSLLAQDALPDVGSWAQGNNGNTWAPDVIDRGDGTFVMYYAALNPTENTHCVGAATSTNPEGPFNPESDPIACNTSQGGAIDPAGFQDTDGTRYVVYKVDGNNLGGGGSCGNGDGSHSTPLMLQPMQSDGVTPNGDAVQILDRDAGDGPLIEAPKLVLVNGVYAVFFSSNCYNTDLYDVSYATASSVKGPYTKAGTPLLVTGNDGLTAPGGMTPTPDGSFAVFHATSNPSPLTRPMWTAQLTWNGNTVTAA
ncbi:glycoside hydrolase family 43 protein [Coniophora puteana RWD-64-598 SS2]|uniref:Glycoside hydrolase family 43 protein n=1 Tax=Coniophora puteana (strain RWD-64-598) TaxID=741705 RepID=A0A5M3MS73_CONPW|nr:glycoside hydrolase family 43 protein [Coniophora puteana RWD-64-598 SS2]EIW81936.1 glycoside hydrolase family 43 protein [Coniophora puteana RWD-64-598 SS2]